MKSAAQLSLNRLEEIAGSSYVSAAPAEVNSRRVDGLLPSAVVQPENVAQISEILRMAAAEKLAVIPSGGCSKLAIGNAPAQY
ncbi:MAG: FAD-binding protein, partial [Bryobacteraceae bacterium]